MKLVFEVFRLFLVHFVKKLFDDARWNAPARRLQGWRKKLRKRKHQLANQLTTSDPWSRKTQAGQKTQFFCALAT